MGPLSTAVIAAHPLGLKVHIDIEQVGVVQVKHADQTLSGDFRELHY